MMVFFLVMVFLDFRLRRSFGKNLCSRTDFRFCMMVHCGFVVVSGRFGARSEMAGKRCCNRSANDSCC